MAGNIHVVAFEDILGAENMLDNVYTWEKNGWIKVEDAVVVTRGTGSDTLSTGVVYPSPDQPAVVPGSSSSREIEIKQTVKRGGKFALGGGGIGLVAGMLLGGPIGGLVVGATIGAITAAMKDYGIPDKMIKQVSEGLRPGTSALFLMSSEGDAEKLIPELQVHKGRLLSTTLPPEGEEALREALEK